MCDSDERSALEVWKYVPAFEYITIMYEKCLKYRRSYKGLGSSEGKTVYIMDLTFLIEPQHMQAI